jgi:hypothetical protein
MDVYTWSSLRLLSLQIAINLNANYSNNKQKNEKIALFLNLFFICSIILYLPRYCDDLFFSVNKIGQILIFIDQMAGLV